MTQQQASPFDEQAALAELERLQAAIQAARRQRMQVNDEFDSFVRTMRQHRLVEGPREPLVRAPDRPRASQSPLGQPARPEPIRPEPAPSMPPVSIEALASSAAADSAPRPRADAAPGRVALVSKSRLRQAGIVAATVAAAALVLLLARSAPDVPATDEAQPEAAQSSGGGPSPAAVPTASAPAPAAAVQIELTTIRPAWMRVIADGKRVIEREVPAGEQLRFSAEQEISVRAGDAGAVQVRVRGGQPAPLGRNGFPVTRRFLPAR
ncbi:MAG TPA: DUF4115 domain-containing protein [Vicinamibacterales bacterium]|nr:DUF4115 domain-containing protein [Vicinamibacterales bacterium]